MRPCPGRGRSWLVPRAGPAGRVDGRAQPVSAAAGGRGAQHPAEQRLAARHDRRVVDRARKADAAQLRSAAASLRFLVPGPQRDARVRQDGFSPSASAMAIASRMRPIARAMAPRLPSAMPAFSVAMASTSRLPRRAPPRARVGEASASSVRPRNEAIARGSSRDRFRQLVSTSARSRAPSLRRLRSRVVAAQRRRPPQVADRERDEQRVPAPRGARSPRGTARRTVELAGPLERDSQAQQDEAVPRRGRRPGSGRHTAAQHSGRGDVGLATARKASRSRTRTSRCDRPSAPKRRAASRRARGRASGPSSAAWRARSVFVASPDTSAMR